MVVAPGKRLSLQFHYRRSEIWKVIVGTVAVKTSLTDEEGQIQELSTETFIQMYKGERQRLIRLFFWNCC